MAGPSSDAPTSRGLRTGWLLRGIAIIVGLTGFLNIAGGVWLLTLGGSPYYALAGFLLIIIAALLWRGRAIGLHLLAGLILVTLAWALAEAGLDFWALVPRGGVLFVVAVFLITPLATRHLSGRSWAAKAGPLAASLLIAGFVAVAAMAMDPRDEVGRLPGTRSPIPAGYGGVPDGDWTAYGHSWRGNKWSPLRQLTPDNVRRLSVAWSLHTGDTKGPGDPDETTYEVTPIKIGDTLYLCTPHNHVLAIDAETGRIRWRFSPGTLIPPGLQHLSCRGVSYHDSRWNGVTHAAGDDCPQRIFMATNNAGLIALDARSGRPCASFGQRGAIELRPDPENYPRGWYQFTSAPLVTRNLVIVGGSIYDNKSIRMPSGVVRAFDVATGRLVWNFDPGNPDATAPLAPGQHYSLSTPNSWSTSAADEELGMIYIPFGNGAVDQWGGNRTPAMERFGSSIVALDLATGRLRWVFQTVHHDLWDMDVPAQPALVDLDIPGRGRVPALVQSTKTGNIFILDRRTGRPVHPVRERPVPGGAAAGDRVSPTQPFSSVSFMPGPAREADMWGVSMFDQLACRIRFRSLRYEGAFTPPSVQGTLVFPGNFGVMDWGGIAIDPVRQVAFAHPNYIAFVDRLIPRGEAPNQQARGPSGGSDFSGSRIKGYNPNAGAPFAAALNPFLSALGLPCQRPPWGYVAGLDLVTGEIVYRHRNGTIRDEAPLPVPLKLGVPSLGGPIVTAGNLAFMTSTLDYYIRAYDLTTGEALWRARLPAGAQSTPMTYWSNASHRQFVVTVAGGHGSLGTELGDSVVAYALPQTDNS